MKIVHGRAFVVSAFTTADATAVAAATATTTTKSINIGFVLYSQLRSRFLFGYFLSLSSCVRYGLTCVHDGILLACNERAMAATATQIDAINGLCTRLSGSSTHIHNPHIFA